MRLDRFLNAIFAWCLRRVGPDDLDKWLFDLREPLPGRPVTQATVQQEMEAFDSFAAAFGITPSTPAR